MKHYIFIIISIIGATLLSSCGSFLDENPHDKINESDAYKTESDLYLNGVAVLYNYVGGHSNSQGLQGTGRGVYDLNTFTTDEAIMPTRGADWYDGGFWQGLYLHNWGTDNSAINDTWSYLYKAIVLCNNSIEHIDAFAAAHPTTDVSAYRAEVRGLRAMFYYYAMDLFGRIPVFTSYSPTTSEMKLQSRSTAFNFIVSELQAVAPLLSTEHSNHSGNYYGRFTQPVAYFILAKLALNAEIYTDDNWTDTTHPSGSDIYWTVDGTKMNTWQATEAYCDKITNLGYSLEKDFTSNFAVYNEGSSENIFTIPMNKYLYTNQFIYLFRSRHYNHASAMGLNGENGSSATIDALKTFGYETQEQDPRFALTYYAGQVFDLKGDSVYLDDGTPLVYYPWKVALDVSSTDYEKTAGARMKKYEVDPTGTKDGNQSENDIVLFRYADVLLMKCEAQVRNGENGDALLNLVRKRVGATSRTATLDNILAERELELAWEGWRRQDLIRFRAFTRAYSDRPQLQNESSGYTIVFPIPVDVLNTTGDKQNSGY
jgi:hypothetical protein